MNFLKILVLAVLTAILYGIVHDQVTIRICPQYFTIFHDKIMETNNLTLIAVGWGVVATWWMGAGVGFALALSARWGMWPRLTWRQLTPSVGILLCVMALFAVGCGIAGYFHGLVPDYMQVELPPNMYRRFAADWWAHMASYASGFFGGLGLCGVTLVRRYRAA